MKRPFDLAILRVSEGVLNVFQAVGRRVYFGKDMIRGLREPATWIPETIRQMRDRKSVV